MSDQNADSKNTTTKQLENTLINLNTAIRRHQDFIRDTYNVSPLEMEFLHFIVNNGPNKMKAISDHFHIKLSTLTSLIDKAERKRILKRINSKEDRRVVYLSATKKGHNIYNEYTSFLKETIKILKKSLDQKTFDSVLMGLASIQEAVTS